MSNALGVNVKQHKYIHCNFNTHVHTHMFKNCTNSHTLETAGKRMPWSKIVSGLIYKSSKAAQKAEAKGFWKTMTLSNCLTTIMWLWLLYKLTTQLKQVSVYVSTHTHAHTEIAAAVSHYNGKLWRVQAFVGDSVLMCVSLWYRQGYYNQ